MTRLHRSLLLQLSCICLLLSWIACKSPGQDDPTIKVPSLGATSVSDVKNTVAKASCPIREVGYGVTGSSTIKEYGICYATKEAPTTSDQKVSAGTSTTATLDIVVNLSGLSPGTSYFVRGYVVYDGGTVYGDQTKFTTESLKAPELSIADATEQSTTAFSITGKLTSLGTSDVTQHGHVLSATSQTPTTADTKTEMGAATVVPKDFKSVFTSLKANTTYYVRAYAVNATGTGYSEVKTIKTSAEVAPTVTIADATELTSSNFNITGRVGSVGTSDVTQFGHCLSETNQNPTVGDTKTEMGGTNVPKDFKSSFGSLKANTTYYVRAYATSPVGTSYSDVKTIKTANEVAPSVTTLTFEQIGTNAARANGTITNGGTRAITQYGHVWSSTNQTPTTSDAKSDFGSTTAPKDYVSGLPGLTINTTYYVRAYATSAAGTGYGEMKTFKTLDAVAPGVTTLDVNQITVNSAGASGTITSVGTKAVTQYGHCWSSSNQNPTTGDPKTDLGGSSVPTKFSSTLAGLSPSTTYYVRSYATSNDGTGYGDVKTFRTLDLQLPIITKPTNPSGIVGVNYFNPYFNVDNPGNLTITEVGLCYSTTNQTPTINDSRVKDTQTGTGLHQSIYMRDLTPSTTYYVRAYAVTSAGIGYSPVNTVKTLSLIAPSVLIYPTGTNSYKYTTLSVGVTKLTYLNFTSSSSIVEGNTSVTSYGTCYSTTNQTPTISDSHTTLTDRSLFGGKVITDNTAFAVVAPNLALSQPAIYVRVYATTNEGIYYSGVQKYTYAP